MNLGISNIMLLTPNGKCVYPQGVPFHPLEVFPDVEAPVRLRGDVRILTWTKLGSSHPLPLVLNSFPICA